MSRQDANAAFALTSFLYGGNAAYIEDLHARYEADPASVDAEWASFFKSLKDDSAAVTRSASGPSWKNHRPLPHPDAELVAALTADWSVLEDSVGRKVKAGAQAARGRAVTQRRAAGHARLDPRPDADPRLPHARPLSRQSRPAGHRGSARRRRTRSQALRLHRSRLRPADLPRQGAGTGIRHAARDRGDPAAHLLPDPRRRIHAHLRSGAEGAGSRSASRARTRRSHSPARASARSCRSWSRPKASRSSATSSLPAPSASASMAASR